MNPVWVLLAAAVAVIGVAAVRRHHAERIHTCLARQYDAPVFRVLTAIGRSDEKLR